MYILKFFVPCWFNSLSCNYFVIFFLILVAILWFILYNYCTLCRNKEDVFMEEKKSNGFAIAALVLGIVSIVFSFIALSWLGLILGIVGIILAVNAKKKNPSGMATAGLVLSIIGTVLCALIFVACIALVGIGVNIYGAAIQSIL